MSDDISNDDDSRLPPSKSPQPPSENEKANNDETSGDESDESEAKSDAYDYERKLESMSESPNRKSNGGESRSTGAALLRGGTITLSMSDDAVRVESNRSAVDETPPPSLAAVFAPSLSPPPSDASAHVAMLSLSNDGDCGGNEVDDPDEYNWDELGRMMSGGARVVVGRRALARSPSEIVFQSRNTETKTVTLTKSKKGYGFQIRGDGPVWISGVDKGSQAEASGLKEGGLLIEVNGRNVEDVNHDTVLKYIAEGPQPLTLSFQLMRHTTKSLSAPVMSGFMTKQGGTGIVRKNWRRRWFVLRKDGCLYYYKNESDIQPLGAIVLRGYTVSKALDLDKKWAFKLIKGGARTYYMLTESEAEMNSWAKALTIVSEVDSSSSSFSSSTTSPPSSLSMGSSAHNVSAPALSIRDPDCHGWLFKQGFHHKSWKRRYCVLKSGCLYYYLDMTDQTAKGVMHMAGYTLKRQSCVGKKHYFMAEPPRADMRPFYFYATSELEYRRWFGKMEESILKSRT